MNFLGLINKCLLELNYKQVNTFSELVKNDHIKIKSALNTVNKEICASEGWNFLLRKTTINLPANTTEVLNTVNGRILYLFVDGVRYDFCEDIEGFLSGNAKPRTYSSFGDKLLFLKFNENKTLNIVYFTNNCVESSEHAEKPDFEYADDATLIPMPFAEQLLVYGACLRLKANSEYFRFPYWQGMYNEALRNLKSKSCAAFKTSPEITLFRR